MEQDRKITLGGGNSKKARNRIIIGVCIIVAAGIAVIGIAQRQHHNKLYGAYCSVGDHEVSKLEYDFFYYSEVNSFINTYGSFLDYMGLDTSQSFSEQEYSEGVTWEEFFEAQTLNLMKEVFALSDAAKESGYEYSDDTYNDFYETVEEYASEYDMSVDDYLKELYGANATKSNIEDILRDYFLASDYAEELMDVTLMPTTEEITEYYEENEDEYDVATFRMFAIYADPSEFEELDEDDTDYSDDAYEKAMAVAKSTAEEFYSQVYDEETFKDLCVEYTDDESMKEYYEDEDYSLCDKYNKASTPTAIADWIFDDAREEKATAIIEDKEEHIYYVVYFINKERDDTPTVNVRHILITPEDVDITIDDNSTEEEIAEYNSAVEEAEEAAEEKANEIYEEWKNGDATQESFAELADEYSDDTADGGLYENVAHGDMVDEFDEWIFDSDRRIGDTDIVKSDYGYHIIYYVSQGDPEWYTEIRDDLIDEAYTEFIENKEKDYPFEDIAGELSYLVLYEEQQQEEANEPELIDGEVEEEEETVDITGIVNDQSESSEYEQEESDDGEVVEENE